MNSIISANANSQGLPMMQYLKMLNWWGTEALKWKRGDIIFREDYRHREAKEL